MASLYWIYYEECYCSKVCTPISSMERQANLLSSSSVCARARAHARTHKIVYLDFKWNLCKIYELRSSVM
jgi:hypothetical protein